MKDRIVRGTVIRLAVENGLFSRIVYETHRPLYLLQSMYYKSQSNLPPHDIRIDPFLGVIQRWELKRGANNPSLVKEFRDENVQKVKQAGSPPNKERGNPGIPPLP